MTLFLRAAVLAVPLILGGLAAGGAQAQMALTPAATTAGWGLSTFASGFPTTGFCCGPLGIEFPASGGVLVANYTGDIYRFATNADNQTVANATIGHTFGAQQPVDLAIAGGQVFMANQYGHAIERLSDAGAYQSTLTTSMQLTFPTGLATNPVSGRMYVSATGGNTGIFEVDTATGATVQLTSGTYDGMTVSADGKHLYAADFDGVVQFSTGVNGAPAFGQENRFDLNDSVDGTALGVGDLAGYLVANTNSGNLYLVELATGTPTLLANGGSRGDFVQVDPNGTLLVTQTDRILRLTAPEGSAFETATPEPGTLGVLGMALAGLVAARRRRSA
jgi:sugar lactone lactonase YvrE